MTTSFATYASQFLNRQQQPSSSLVSTSQPLFYSFTTDNGSHTEDMSHEDDDIEFDDEDDPHLGRSIEYASRHTELLPDDDDPYLRLDEDDPSSNRPPHNTESIPLIESERLAQHRSVPPEQGWLAHQGVPSSPSDTSSDSGVPPVDLLHTTRPERTTSNQGRRANAITESLLPRDGTSRPVDVFSLPDPRSRSKGRLIHKDSFWTAAWLGSVTACVLGSFIILFTTSTPKDAPKQLILPYTVLLHSIPLLTMLTFLSAVMSYIHIFLLRVFVKPVIFATSVFIPATLFISAIWAFVGSFVWEEGQEPSWGESVGLRLFSLIPLILAILTARRLVNLSQEIHTTSSVLALSTTLLMSNPFLLALSPLILLITLLSSIPFLTLAFRLLLIGYSTSSGGNAWEWHVKNWAGWAITGTICVWLWCWGVARGIMRVACAAVIGAWYFSSTSATSPPPLDTYRIHAALSRSADASLGSVVLSALLLTSARVLSLFTMLMRRAPLPVLSIMTLPLKFLDTATGALNSLALVYVGLTGDAFFPSAKRARALTAAIASSGGKTRYRRSGADPSLGILTITPLTLTFPFALSAYLFIAHTLGAPGYAPLGALLTGGVTVLVGRFCTGLVEDTADTLYVCYCIDRDTGMQRQGEVFHAFEWQTPHGRSERVLPISTVQHATQPLKANPHYISPSPLTTDSGGEIELQQSEMRSPPITQAKLHSSTGPVARRLEESQESEESMMLGLDFV